MEPGQGIWLWVGIGFLTIGVGILLWNLFRLTDSTAFPENRWKYLYGVVYSCYPMGVGCKAALLGPDFVRFHLSDVGFPAVLALIIFRHFWGGYSKDNDHLRQQHWTEQALTYVRYRKNVLIVALILSILYEWATGIFWAVMGDKPSLIGGFDWWDVACYGVGFCLAFFTLMRWEGVVRLLSQDAKTQEAQRAETERQRRRLANKERRREARAKRPHKKKGR